jgi:CheY-like chemotaxis protein
VTAQPLPKVLVIDDDPVVGRSFDRVLSGKGYAVVTACDGEEALRKMAAEEYDAVFTDIKMPGMDGISVAEQIKRNRPWLPVVIVSGYATAENEARARAAGVSTVLHKPLSPQMIEQSAREALRTRLADEVAIATPAEAPVAPQPAAAAESTATPRPRSIARWAGHVALFFAAPFIGLAYIVALPFVGLGVLAHAGYKAVIERRS